MIAALAWIAAGSILIVYGLAGFALEIGSDVRRIGRAISLLLAMTDESDDDQ